MAILEAEAGLDFRAVFDAVPGLYLILDRRLTIVAANDAYCRATMTNAAQIAARPLFDVFPDNPGDPAADGVRNLRASLDRVLAFKRPDAIAVQKYDIRMPDGAFQERYWSPLNTPILDRDGAVAWIVHRVEDVTELMRLKIREESQDQLARDQQRVIEELRQANLDLNQAMAKNAKLQTDRIYLADIVNSSNDAIISRAVDGRIASWNRAAEAMFGYQRGEIVGMPSTELTPPHLHHEAEDILRRHEAGEQVIRYETTRIRKDGSALTVAITTSPVMNHEGKVIGSSAIMRDVTEARASQERIKSLQAELIHLSRWNMMGMMASTLAHELNQPLTAVMNYARAARRLINAPAPQTERATEYLDKAVDETKLAGGIIRSLREFIDKRETSREPQDLNNIVEEAIALSVASEAGHRVEPQLMLMPSPLPVLVDKIQIEQVLLNLIRNALDAMEGAKDARLVIRTEQGEPGFLQVSVCDTGPGIAPDILSRLFQPFVTTKSQGMGIGLTICQSIIEAHGGKIWAEFNTPRGTIFVFRLPLLADAA